VHRKDAKEESILHSISDPTRALGKKERTHKDQLTTSSSFASAQDTQKVKLKTAISTISSTFSEADPVTITFSIANVGGIQVKILKWFIPPSSIDADVLKGNFFSVKYAIQSGSQTSENGRVASGTYIGALVKRATPTDEDFLVLKPGQRYTATFDLANYYAFSNGGVYTVVYDVNEAQMLHETGSNGGATRLVSNKLQLNVAGRFKPSYSVISVVNAAAGAATNSFNGCSTTQQSLIITARNDALTCSTYLNDVYMNTFDPANTNARYTEWFGLDTLSLNVGTVKSHVTSIKSVFLSADMAFDCTCTDSSYAYVYTNQPYKIYLCKAFWNAPAKGTDSKMGTLYHETSHFDIVANTDDVVYGQSGCRSLALSNPSKAVTNADSNEYFCESSILADPRPPSKPVASPISKPVKPAPVLVSKPAPIAKPAPAKPIAKPASAKPIAKPAPAKPISKPAPAKPAPSKPAVKPAAVKPAPFKPARKPVKPSAAPLKKPSKKPSTTPSTYYYYY
jgi:peptidyl-Lys metalloendopeptidase